jgi:hypothetical protein
MATFDMKVTIIHVKYNDGEEKTFAFDNRQIAKEMFARFVSERMSKQNIKHLSMNNIEIPILEKSDER